MQILVGKEYIMGELTASVTSSLLDRECSFGHVCIRRQNYRSFPFSHLYGYLSPMDATLARYEATDIYQNLLRPSTGNVLTQSIPSDFFPFNLLPRNRQLPSQSLKRALREPGKGLVQLSLVFSLRSRDALDYRICGRR